MLPVSVKQLEICQENVYNEAILSKKQDGYVVLENSQKNVSNRVPFKQFDLSNLLPTIRLVTFTEEILNGKLHLWCSDFFSFLSSQVNTTLGYYPVFSIDPKLQSKVATATHSLLKMKIFVKDFFSKCEQIQMKRIIYVYLLNISCKLQFYAVNTAILLVLVSFSDFAQ